MRRGADLAGAGLLVLFGLAIHLALEMSFGRTLAGEAVDTDSYARLIRVRELWAGAAWTDPITSSFSAPDGLYLHWTRPLDVMILGPAWLLHHLFGLGPDRAVFASGAVICPLQHVATALVAVWAARAVWPRHPAWLAGLLTIAALQLLAYSLPGRADHHTLVALSGAACLGAGLRALRGRRPAGMAWFCGAAGGFGLWVSPETQLSLVPILAGFGTAFLSGPDPQGAAKQGARAAAGAMAMVAIAILTERGPVGLDMVAYDLIALPHLAMTGAAVLVLAGCSLTTGGAASRLLVAGLLSVFALVLLVQVFPGLPSASMADAGPEAQRLFLPHVQELQPLRFDSLAAIRRSLAALGGAALLAPFVLMAVAPSWMRGARRVLLAPLAFLLLLNLAATISSTRFAVDLAVPAVVVAAGLPWLLSRRLKAAPLLASLGRVLTMLVLVLVPLIGPADEAVAEAEVEAKQCAAEPIAHWLAGMLPAAQGLQRPIIFNPDLNAGPALAWLAPVRVVAGPYHRGEQAFSDTAILVAAENESALKAVLRRRQASFLLVCRRQRDGAGPALAKLLGGGPPPPWLAPVELPADLAAHFALWRVE